MKSVRCIWFQLKYLIFVYVIGIIYLPTEYVRRKFRRTPSLHSYDMPRQDDTYAVVTGGTRGIGLEVVCKLASLGMNVIVGSSSVPKESKACVQDLQRKYPNLLLQIWLLDLSSMKSVQEFANRFLSKGYPLHLLILNAGIMYAPYEVTEDGFEKQFCVNYLGHCLLTKLLLKRLQTTGSKERYARIINVSSCCHFAGEINFNDLQSKNTYSSHFCYAQSKLAQVMFTYSLQRYLESQSCYISVNCLHPGVIHTDLYRYVWWVNKWTAFLFKKPEEGTDTVLYAALSPKMEGIGGKYLEECTIIESSVYSTKIHHQDQLWDLTSSLLKPWL